MDDMNVQQPKRRGRPPKVRPIEPVKLPEGVVKAEDAHGFSTCEEATRAPDEPDGTLPTVSLSADRIVTIHAPVPLLTLHLRRAGNEITDATGKVHIPASGAIPDGTKLVAHFYREE